MHILLIHQAFTTLDEAGGTRHAELSEYLIEHGHKVTVITSPLSYLSGKAAPVVDDRMTGRMDSGLTIHQCATYNALHRSFVHRVFSYISFMCSSFIKAMQIHDVDVVWGTSPPIFQAASTWLVSRLKRTAFLLEIRDLWPAFAIATGILRNRVLIALSEWLERFLYKNADHVLVNSPGFIKHIKDRKARDVTLIPNGVDTSLFNIETDPVAFRSACGLKDQFVVVYAGAHGFSNDLGVVLDAADLLRGDERIRFLLVGDGKDKPLLMEQAKQKQLDNVLFLPPRPKREMPEVLLAADACLAILKPLEMYKTTYPNKVFDYMAASKPVLLAIDGVIREVVESAGCGIFVKPGSARALAAAVDHLVDHPAACKVMGQAGYRYVLKHFDRRQIAQDFLDLLMKLNQKVVT